MGKTKGSAAAKKIRNAAKAKNLDFLSENKSSMAQKGKKSKPVPAVEETAVQRRGNPLCTSNIRNSIARNAPKAANSSIPALVSANSMAALPIEGQSCSSDVINSAARNTSRALNTSTPVPVAASSAATSVAIAQKGKKSKPVPAVEETAVQRRGNPLCTSNIRNSVARNAPKAANTSPPALDSANYMVALPIGVQYCSSNDINSAARNTSRALNTSTPVPVAARSAATSVASHLIDLQSSTSNVVYSASRNAPEALNMSMPESIDTGLINVKASTSRQQVNLFTDILMDWDSDSDTNIAKDGPLEPAKPIGRTYGGAKTGHTIGPSSSEHLDQQVDLSEATTDHTTDPSTAGRFNQPVVLSSNDIVCVCGQQTKINDLIQRNNEQASLIKKLKQKSKENKRRCFNLTDSLNAKILGKPHIDVFTAVDGYPTVDKLRKFSEAAAAVDSDYVFVKLLMREIWQDGFKNRSVTGRPSNNPNGRSGAGAVEVNAVGLAKIALEPEKILYVEERLAEHREYQGDDKHTAMLTARECGRLMARVLAYYGKKEGIAPRAMPQQ